MQLNGTAGISSDRNQLEFSVPKMWILRARIKSCTVLRWPNTVFLYVPTRYSSLFSKHWQMGGQNWQDTSSTNKDYILICHWTKHRCHGNTASNKPALNNGCDLFSENPVVRFFPSFVSRELRKIRAY